MNVITKYLDGNGKLLCNLSASIKESNKMDKQSIIKIYIWNNDGIATDVNFARNGIFGYTEHLYEDITVSSELRLLKFLLNNPDNDVKIFE